jgi:hypothetical protein
MNTHLGTFNTCADQTTGSATPRLHWLTAIDHDIVAFYSPNRRICHLVASCIACQQWIKQSRCLGEYAYYTRREWSEAQGRGDIGMKVCDMEYDSLSMGLSFMGFVL